MSDLTKQEWHQLGVLFACSIPAAAFILGLFIYLAADKIDLDAVTHCDPGSTCNISSEKD